MNEKMSFADAMRKAGIAPPAEIIDDGKIHRFHVTGDSPRSKNGWYIFHADNPPAGQFGCWKRRISETWCAKPEGAILPTERQLLHQRSEEVRRQRNDERERERAECQSWCTKRWRQGKEASDAHPYLKRKGVSAHGLRLLRGNLMVPLLDVEGTIHGLQFIRPDGVKKFKRGTVKKGHFYAIGTMDDNIILIAEGFATGASIHAATEKTVLVSFDTGNIKQVAGIVRNWRPAVKIIVCADDDRWNRDGSNPGLREATEAARTINGLLAVPVFQDITTMPTDFNDLYLAEGAESVRRCIEEARHV
jgi:putative DNA primase/helicase